MKVTVAEDDFALSLFLKKGLEMDGYAVRCIADGVATLAHIEDDAPDLLLLDLGLPRMDGVDVLRALRDRVSTMSVVVLTGRATLSQKIECLNLGADDYLTKPFSLHELLARCRAVIRRRIATGTGVLRNGPLTMDRMARSVYFSGVSVEFTTKEFALLEYLLLQRGRAVSRKELLEMVWHVPVDAGTNIVDVYVNYLRRKLSAVGSTDLIGTVRGEGYVIGNDRKPLRHNLMIHPLSIECQAHITTMGAA
jgi:DNA-binding response OmpR family regulator